MPVAAESLINVPIPQGVHVTYVDRTLNVKGARGSLSRIFTHPRVEMSVAGGTIQTRCSLPRMKEKALVGTWAAHAKNMVVGVTEGFQCKMKIVYAHFPMKATVDRKTSLFRISNFMGEKLDRQARILEQVDVRVDGDQVTITGIDKERVGQTAANIESSTRIRGFDNRVFQDGIYITQKPVRGGAND